MRDQELREAIEEGLAAGPQRASELVRLIVEQHGNDGPSDEESIRALIWRLVENNELQWEPDSRLAMPKPAQYA